MLYEPNLLCINFSTNMKHEYNIDLKPYIY